MDENKYETSTEPVNTGKKEALPEVIMVRNWKEYLGESMLIVFSVILALLLTELFNKIHENKRDTEILRQLKQELANNKKAAGGQYTYHLQVLKNIDSALANPSFARQFIDSGQIHLTTIAPLGVLHGDLNDVAWQIAKENNILSKLDLDTYSLLTDIYDQQLRITKTEDEIAKVLLSWESRKPENLRTALLLTSNNYHGWAVDRAPALLIKYEEAINKLSRY